MDIHWDTLTDPIKDFFTNVFDYLPRLLAAGALLVLAWILAKVARYLVRRALVAAKVDERVGHGLLLAQRAGTAVYWFVWLFFFLAILETLGVKGMLDPIQQMVDKALTALPTIVAAIILLVVAFLLGRLLAGWITKAPTSARFNELPVRLGITKRVAEGRWR